MLAQSRITRSELYIFDPDLVTQSVSTANEDDAELTVLRRCPYSYQRQRPASDYLPCTADRLPLCDVPAWTRTANDDSSGVDGVMDCHVVEVEADRLPSIGRAVTVTVYPDNMKTRPCCIIS